MSGPRPAEAAEADAATKELLCDLLRGFHARGWASGTGGGICGPTADGNLFLAPTGVHKERVRPEDLCVVSPSDGRVLVEPDTAGLRPSECNAIFCLAVRERGARSAAHSHALPSVLAADLAGEADHLEIAGLEMLKGIRGVSNRDTHRVPVVNNTARAGARFADRGGPARRALPARLRGSRARPRGVHLGRRRVGDKAPHRGLSLPVRGRRRAASSLNEKLAMSEHRHQCPTCQQTLPLTRVDVVDVEAAIAADNQDRVWLD